MVDQSELVGQQQFPPASPELPPHAPNSGFDSRDGGQYTRDEPLDPMRGVEFPFAENH